MPRPPTTEFQEDLYAQFPAWADRDKDYAWSLLYYLGALSAMFDQVYGYAKDDQALGAAGWSILLDIDRCPAEALPWLGQFVGVRVTTGLDEAGQRLEVRTAAGLQRGTPAAMRAAIERTLTGTKTVYIEERQGGAWRLGVATLVSETPDPAATEAAARSQKPIGIIMNFDTIVGGDYETLRDTHTTYQDVKDTFTDYLDVRTDPSQQ